ncbi:MAG: hypothetical protein RL432_487 [Bacteroidota bacterium]|jgi:single-stranded DNA-binding protein
MNFVSLIGKMEKHPVFGEMRGGMCCSRFKLITETTWVDSDGKARKSHQKHDVFAWGKWQQLLVDVGQPNLPMAIEGRLVNRYIRWNGRPIKITEVEVNDLLLL